MRILPSVVLTGLAAVALPAAAVKVVNKDSTSHDLTIKCSTTTQGSVGASSTRDIGQGPCTVIVKKTGSQVTGSGNDQLVIRGGRIGTGSP